MIKIEAAAIASTTLLTRLLVRLEREGIVTPEFIDELMNDAVGVSQDSSAVHPVNEQAEEVLHQLWSALHEERHRTSG